MHLFYNYLFFILGRGCARFRSMVKERIHIKHLLPGVVQRTGREKRCVHREQDVDIGGNALVATAQN